MPGPRRWSGVLGVLALVYLVVSVQPVGAASAGLVVGSQHTDFGTGTEASPAKLENLTISGTGNDANVTLTTTTAGPAYSDSFEDQSISDYGGDTGSFQIGTLAQDGTYAVNSTAPGSLSRTDDTFQRGAEFEAWIRLSTYEGALVFFAQNETSTPSGYQAYLDENGNDWKLFSPSGKLAEDNNIGLTIGTWYRVKVRTFASNNTIIGDLYLSDGTLHGRWSATTTTYTSGGIGLKANGQDMIYDNISAGTEVDPADSATYHSANHSVTNASQATINISELTNASAVLSVDEINQGSGKGWQQVSQTTVTTTGNHSLDISAASNSTLRVNVTFLNQSGNGDPSATLSDESILFTDQEPLVDNSSASPTGDLNARTQTLSIDVNDTEFGTAQGETVTVEFFVDGTSTGTDTLNSNGTATQSHTFTDGGSHTWNVSATDSYGLTNRSADFTVNVPGTLEIREETPPHDLIDSATAQVKIFEQTDDNPLIVNRTTSNGQLDLTGLPVTSQFVVTIKAPGYHNRSILIESIFDQETAFLINTSRTTVEERFEVEDRTGNFPPGETELIVQKAINRSLYGGTPANFSWTNMAGDELGADQQLVVDLEEGDRYRLKIRNSEGDVRILGAHTPETTGTVVLQVGNVIAAIEGDGTYSWNATRVNVSGTQTIRFQYNDSTDSTTDLQLAIYERGNKSNEIYNQTHAGPLGTLAVDQPLTTQQENTTWIVDWEATRNGETIGAKTVVGAVRQERLTQLPWWVRQSIAILSVMLTAGLFGGVRAELGALVAALVGGVFWYIGFMPPEITGGVVFLAMGFSGLVYVRAQGGIT